MNKNKGKCLNQHFKKINKKHSPKFAVLQFSALMVNSPISNTDKIIVKHGHVRERGSLSPLIELSYTAAV